ncbi:mandelate racemase/muconate lactonizing enzyme family protein [Advenella mimigardefordensis]|uniref:Putative mandelate racemase/muconate lactonizing enzyme family protein n=1 Tax=Advenella mimigardefordensis (strain DSM 17166 / LMG 22922 / DPN7) TaxID=1247726 RepID=W0PGV7_ADVMD|nr:enolase C-terminal domain-like protein [Advenella mimigardefordensis]AHG64615.1 putative mandelate racemase/muconate lactonizing enzyme family protein [Advenella mimigardefordensis DPN7]
MKLADWSLRFYRIPYVHTVHWANAVEEEGVYALLTLRNEQGQAGYAEGTLKATWSGVSPAMLQAAFEDILIPQLTDTDLSEDQAVARALAPIPENRLGKGMIETAARLLCAADRQQPYWRYAQGQNTVEVAWTLTRQSPAKMVAQALEQYEQHGIHSFKVKGGQGIETDLAVLRALHDALPVHCRYIVDANSHYTPAETPHYLERLANCGVEYAEDPCPLESLSMFESLQRESPLPILIDRACTTEQDADRFLQAGALALSTKPGRIGMGEAYRIRQLTAQHGATTTVGIYAESALGTLINLQWAASCPDELNAFPAEQTFYLGLMASPLRKALVLKDGAIHLPDEPLNESALQLDSLSF